MGVNWVTVDNSSHGGDAVGISATLLHCGESLGYRSLCMFFDRSLIVFVETVSPCDRQSKPCTCYNAKQS